MIARHWRGVARRERAEAYIEHLRAETFPALARLPGFLSASILRRRVPEGEEFLVITNWESLAAIRAFAGEDVEGAVVPDTVQEMMVSFDRTARHYEVVT
jgi:heme-degrading monooxygenase HmoA